MGRRCWWDDYGHPTEADATTLREQGWPDKTGDAVSAAPLLMRTRDLYDDFANADPVDALLMLTLDSAGEAPIPGAIYVLMSYDSASGKIDPILVSDPAQVATINSAGADG